MYAKSKIKLVNINGGLGNQLFQYFFGKYIVGQSGSVSFLINDIRNYNSHQGLELNKIINENIDYTSSSKCFFHKTSTKKILSKISCLKKTWNHNYFEESNTFISRKDIESNQSFIGYWQNIKYLEPFKDKILRDISFDVN